MKPLALLLFLFFTHNEALRISGPFSLEVVRVWSIAPERKLGYFTKSLPVYAVDAKSPNMAYLLYCTTAAPQSGHTYEASEEFVSENYSPLHLWPVERNALPVQAPSKGDKRLYKVVIITKLTTGPRSDHACDIHDETELR